MLKEGYKKTEVGVIPEYWKVVKLDDLTNKTRGISYGVLKPEEYTENGIPMIRIVNLDNGKINSSNMHLISESLSSQYNRTVLQGEEVLISLVGTVGSVAYVEDKYKGYNVHRNIGVIPVNETMNPKYLNYYLDSILGKKEISLRTIGGNQPLLNLADLKMIKIIVPPLKEQEKIAEILSTVDCQIDDTEKLIETCRVLKKGLIQRLLTKGIGHTEFKKTEVGEIPVGWEVKKLGDISIGKGQYGIGASATDYKEGNPRYLRITDIGDSGNLLHEDIKGLDDDNYMDYILEEGDIVFARTGNTTGKTYVYSELDGDLVYAGFLIRFKLNPKLVLKDFVKYVVQTKRYWDWVQVMSTRSGQPGINSNEYSDFKVQIPPLEEQKKISDILLTLDNEILEYSYKKEELNLLKKGLMQQLLTGNKRVCNY